MIPLPGLSNLASSRFLQWVDVCLLTCFWPHQSVNTPPESGYGACVSLSGAQTARGSYRSIVRTRQGALFPLLLPGADFHPRWAGGRLDSLLVWHSLDDLGGMDGRHAAIHGHITGNRRAVLLHRYFPANPLSL